MEMWREFVGGVSSATGSKNSWSVTMSVVFIKDGSIINPKHESSVLNDSANYLNPTIAKLRNHLPKHKTLPLPVYAEIDIMLPKSNVSTKSAQKSDQISLYFCWQLSEITAF